MAAKGLGAWQFPLAKASEVKATWAYNWEPYDHGSGNGVEHVPMIWGNKHDADWAFKAAADSPSKFLLGFNEPDGGDQANMSVDNALDIWPKLLATGKILGSPAVARNYNWLDAFFAGLRQRNLPPPAFVAFHNYPDMQNVDSFIGLISWVHERYKLPVWVTEFGALGRSWDNEIGAFIQQVIPRLNALPFIERYAWFCDAAYSGASGNIFDWNGNLTNVGRFYRDAT